MSRDETLKLYNEIERLKKILLVYKGAIEDLEKKIKDLCEAKTKTK